jgi:hypothetical protein
MKRATRRRAAPGSDCQGRHAAPPGRSQSWSLDLEATAVAAATATLKLQWRRRGSYSHAHNATQPQSCGNELQQVHARHR